jgi:hypothetical protein
MNSRYFIALVAITLVTGCQYHARKFAGENPPAGTRVNWPPAAYDEVRGYCYDFQADISRSFMHSNRMHKGVMDPKGVLLSKEQTAQLVEAVTVSQPKSARTPCYAPHHAFVFYSKGSPVAVFEMCFGCNQFKNYPGETLPEYVDTASLWNLCQQLGLPLGTGNEFYARAVADFRRTQAQ